MAVLLATTVATIAASAQTSGTEQSAIAPTPIDPMIQQQDQTIQERALERLQDRAEEGEDFLNTLD